jgi:hypothetical protein
MGAPVDADSLSFVSWPRHRPDRNRQLMFVKLYWSSLSVILDVTDRYEPTFGVWRSEVDVWRDQAPLQCKYRLDYTRDAIRECQ